MSICISHLAKSYDGKAVLKDFSMMLENGKRYCLYGPSGCGKTTLLRLLAGLERADSGELSGLPGKIAFVFQEDRLFEDFSALSNVQPVCLQMKKEDILQHLAEVGLPAGKEAAKKPVRLYSGGMKRRLALVRAVCFDAPLLLLDEPFNGLDGETKKTVISYLLRHTEGKTLLCVSHAEEDAGLLGAEGIAMADGVLC